MTKSQGWVMVSAMWVIVVVLLKSIGAPADVVFPAGLMVVGASVMAFVASTEKD